MVLHQWIIPEPNPQLRLTIDQIDYSKLNFEDCRWIYSSAMKKYHRDFSQLEGFIEYASRLFDLEELKQNQKKIKEQEQKRIKQIIPQTPPYIYDSINNERFTKKKFPFKKIPFLKKHSKLSIHSESCTIH